MSLPGLMSALVEYVGDVLVNECDRQVPERVLRYFGRAGLPQDCCTERGVLSVTWDRGWGSQEFPADAVQRTGNPCPGYPVYELVIRYDTCWNVPKKASSGVTLLDDEWDEDAAELAATADCVARALLRLPCAEQGALGQAVLAQLADPERIKLREVATGGPLGGCARLVWRVYAAPSAPAPEPIS